MDLNMVRAGVVNHPENWAHGGYQEIQNTPKRYRIINTGVFGEIGTITPRYFTLRCDVIRTSFIGISF
jgi:hypothetical protein